MLTLFNNITEKLTDFEKEKLVPMLLEVLKDTHENRRITGGRLSSWYKMAGYSSVSDIRIRKMVNYTRQMNLCSPAILIGSSSGYFITTMLTVVDMQIESLEGRVDSQQAVIDALKAQRENLKRLQ
ncbi:MAG: hypothetical protein ABL876_17115 [Chitinophagaceae bacterium]